MPESLPVHPRTGLQAVGIVGGRPVWPVLGAEDDPANPVQPPAGGGAPEGGEPKEPDAPAEPADKGEPAKKAEPGDGGGDGGADEPKELKDARRQAGNYRTKLRAEEEARATADAAAAAAKAENEKLTAVLDAFKKALDPEGAKKDEPLDPAKLAAQLASQEETAAAELAKRDAIIRTQNVQLALPAVFAKLDAKPGLTTKVLKADGVLDKLDPSSKTFAADLESAVKEAIDEDPSLKVTPVVVKTGNEPTGRTGATNQLTSLEGLSPEQIVEAQKAGRLKKLLGGS
jgi:hypothetical protein